MIVHMTISEESLLNNSRLLGVLPRSPLGVRTDIFKQAALLIGLLFNRQGANKIIKVGKRCKQEQMCYL